MRQAVAMASPDDGRDLIAAHLQGDPGAFGALVDRHGPMVYAVVGRYGLGPAERDDVFQEVFVRVHRSAALYRPERPLKPWLVSIAVNAARTFLTRRRGRELSEDRPAAERLVDPAPDGARVAEARQATRLLAQALDALPDEQREAVLLVGVQQLAYDEAAAILEIPLNTLKSRVRRGRLALARALDDAEVVR